MGKPMAVPRSQGFQDRFQSSRDIQMDPLMAMGFSSLNRWRDATCSASPRANRPTASVVTSTPSSRFGTPKASRAWPVSWSMPISPSHSPMARLVSPRRGEDPKVADTVTKAISISPK